MKETNSDLRSVILKFLEEFETQKTEAQLTELQKMMFLFQRLSKKYFVKYSIFNYGPYSFELEHALDELLLERSVDRYGSKYRVTGAVPNSEYENTIKNITLLLKSTTPTEMQKACTVMYFWDKSGNENEAVEKAQSVSLKSDIADFRKAYGDLSGRLTALAAQ